ncbi:MAG: fibronectin type III domain-containing protein, partial [Bacteroidetes bacterium]
MLNNKLTLLFLLTGFFILTTCKKVEKEMLVSTGEATNILVNSADVSGLIIDLGEGVTQHGHCYATTANVTISGLKTQLGIPAGKGGFTSQLTGLTAGTKYYIKAYIRNEAQTVYGKEISFSTVSATPPTAPTIGTATAGNAQATVTFIAPASDGGSAITGYTATSSPGGLTGTAGSVSPITVTGLTNGTPYTFTVTATNANGTGPASSASNSITPSAVPGAPTIGTATKGNAQATVTFTAPASDGGSAITGYTATSSPG